MRFCRAPHGPPRPREATGQWTLEHLCCSLRRASARGRFCSLGQCLQIVLGVTTVVGWSWSFRVEARDAAKQPMMPRAAHEGMTWHPASAALRWEDVVLVTRVRGRRKGWSRGYSGGDESIAGKERNG